jgi:hypothetical protein
MKSNTKQHYVPRFYLRSWANAAGSIWCFPVSAGKPFETSVDNVACERGLYSHPVKDGKYPLATEKIMAKIEGHYASKWPDICDRAEHPDTRKNIARFVALMALRHPESEAQVRHLNASFRAAVSGMAPDDTISIEHGTQSAVCTVAEVLQGTGEDKDTIKSAFLRLLPAQIESIADVLVQRRWGIVFSDSPAFVTSDYPVVLHRGTATKKNIGFRTPGTQILFPISPTRLLAIADEWPHDFAHYKLTKRDLFNRIIVRAAVRFVLFNQNDSHLAAQIPLWRVRQT